MRVRLPSLILLFVVAAIAVPGAVSAKPIIGISDNRPTMLVDPNFAALGAKHVRIVVSYNAVAAAAKGDNEISDKIGPYIAEAAASGVEPMVAFEHSRGDPTNCSGHKSAQCKLPSVAAYKKQVKAFLQVFPTVKVITAWNESNHNTQPTLDNPKRAGQYAKAADQACKELNRGCTVVAMDILDAANDPKASKKKLNYSRTIKYVKQVRKGYGKTPAVCGIHNYADVNRFRTSGTKAIVKAGKCKAYWLTETGGFYNFASFWSKETRKGKCKKAADCQVTALKYLFSKTIKVSSKIKRAYIYNFYSGSDGRFDAGITKGEGDTNTSKKRPAFNIVKSHI